MKVMVASDAHFLIDNRGIIYTETTDTYNFWKRYADVFGEVVVLARVRRVDLISDKYVKASGHNVKFCCIPDYLGPIEYFKNSIEIKKIIKKCIKDCDRYILRLPSQIGSLAYKEIKKNKKEYAVEIGGDPWEALRKGTIKNITRPIARVVFTIRLHNQCKNAKAASYVTKYELQKRYPCKNKSYSYSDVQLNSNQLKEDREIKTKDKSIIEIVNVGSMATLYKCQDVQIKAIKICIDKGYHVKLKLIGDGVCRKDFERLATELELNDKVDFRGMISGNDNVIKELDKSDIFILPSLVEGLPRALIEAMARGLPCIASNVGGIPELLDKEFLVDRGSEIHLADKIIELIERRCDWEEIGIRNKNIAKEYTSEYLDTTRKEFYNYILEN